MPPTKVRFILGPAGSGKTWHCVTSARQALAESADGPPLLFIAPKQATFQIESQVVDGEAIQGYTRLQVLSIPRLAEYLLSEFAPDSSQVLNEDGRLMVLRSLLAQHGAELQAFQSAAAIPEFAQEIGQLLQDLARHQLNADALKSLASRSDLTPSLQKKLADLEILSRRYRDWLDHNQLKDPECLLELATEQVRRLGPLEATQHPFWIDQLWLDGFGEMTPQELDLVTAVVRHTREATIAFCLDPMAPVSDSWLDLWAPIRETYERCRTRFEALDTVTVESLPFPLPGTSTRFTSETPLAHLESAWNQAVRPGPEVSGDPPPLQIAVAEDRENEVTHAARTLLRFVRETPSRFRRAAVIVRQLADYAEIIKRTFDRYQIPYFIDQRDPIRHHPAVLLTQSALRLVLFRWRTEDWMSALKTMLVHPDRERLFALENVAIEFGWDGSQWLTGPQSSQSDPTALDSFRREVIRPFLQLESTLEVGTPDSPRPVPGLRMVQAIREFWEQVHLEDNLAQWDLELQTNTLESSEASRPIHSAVFEQLRDWIDNVELAFTDTHRTLREWLPILETGLSSLSVGVIPPTLDQVLVGSVDRTRSPDIDLAIVLGLNESVFPASPAAPPLLTEWDRQQLAESLDSFLPSPKRQLAVERFYGYIACTRASTQLVVSYARQAPDGKQLNPSWLVHHLHRLSPGLTEATVEPQADFATAQHVSELIQPLFHQLVHGHPLPEWAAGLGLNPSELSVPDPDDSQQGLRLPPELSQRLYLNRNQSLPTSVSRLEQFAACPFRFFVHSGLRCDEREEFQLDARRLGSFQHQVLEDFHHQIEAEGIRWRDLSPTTARNRIATLAKHVAQTFHHGIFLRTDEARFALENTIERLQEFIGIIIEWMEQYEFDPTAVELGFGGEQDTVGPWHVKLDEGRLAFVGKIDRLDLHRAPNQIAAPTVVIDYKSSGKKLDPVLMHEGVQLQLLTYLNVIEKLPELAQHLGVERLQPTGVFFVPLRGHSPRSRTRDDARLQHSEHRPRAFQHVGCFDRTALRLLDNRAEAAQGDQIQYALKKDGTPKKTAWNVMEPEVFDSLMHQTETAVRNMGNRILAGDIAVTPYQHRQQTPCQYCQYAAVCRIDPETHPFRPLEMPATQASS